MTGRIDCLIVGGGPAGLTAAIYAARFRLSVAVFDAGHGRAASIPRSHNHAGFPDGVTGLELLERMRRQAVKYGARVLDARVERLQRAEVGFVATSPTAEIAARAVILATGVTNRRPAWPKDLHDAALASGRLRYCPVCDGYEVTDQTVAVFGTSDHGLREALFLRAYTSRLTLIAPTGTHELTAAQRHELTDAGVAILEGQTSEVALDPAGLALVIGDRRMTFEAVYPALGSEVHSGLARDLGADLTDEGCIRVDGHQRTSVPGLYAAGDVVIGLDQISHAMGEAGVAATTLRNDLAQSAPLRR